MRYASVCDGIGAAHVAWQPLGWECAWTSEIEPFPAAVVDHHWKFKNLGDMTKLTEEMLNECGAIDLLVGGTPCQSFSVAGLRGGLADPRGNLALRFVQLVGVLRPSWVVWENVPGVLSSGGGRDFGTFLGALAELGYGFAYRVLDAQWFGVAQRRRRVFVVGYLGDWRRAAAVLFERESVFGNPPTRGKAWEGIACATPISTRTGRSDDRGDGCDNLVAESHTIAFGGQMSTPQVDVELSQTLQRKNPQAVAVDTYNQAIGDVSIPLRVGNAKDSLPAAMVAFAIDGGNQAASEEVHHSLRTGRDSGDAVAFTTEQTPKFKHDCALTMTKQSPSGGGQPQCVAFKPSHYTRGKDGAPSNVTAPLSADADRGDQDTVVASCEVSSSLRANPGSGWRSNGTPVEGVVISPMAVRRLTPKECERLQGFPDGYTAVTYRGKPAADGPRYRALGNSMAVPVMAWIGQRIQMVEEAADGR